MVNNACTAVHSLTQSPPTHKWVLHIPTATQNPPDLNHCASQDVVTRTAHCSCLNFTNTRGRGGRPRPDYGNRFYFNGLWGRGVTLPPDPSTTLPSNPTSKTALTRSRSLIRYSPHCTGGFPHQRREVCCVQQLDQRGETDGGGPREKKLSGHIRN